MIEPGPGGRVQYLATTGKLLLHRYNLIDELSPAETRQLYLSTCTRKCHSKDVIELTPRTALEWEQIVARMKTQAKADIAETEARTIVEFLQRNYLSNVPTILPGGDHALPQEASVAVGFRRERPLFRHHLSASRLPLPDALPGVQEQTAGQRRGLFIVYVNTHTGILPRWNLADIAAIRIDGGREAKATAWQVLYEDGQQHHKQGILTFPALAGSDGGKRTGFSGNGDPAAGHARAGLSLAPAGPGRRAGRKGSDGRKGANHDLARAESLCFSSF